jgi:hypothetical protein
LVAVLSPAAAVGLAECQVGNTTAVLKELIADAEERLDHLERAADQRRIG